MTNKEKIDKVKQLLGLNPNTDKEDMEERHRKIIEDIEQ